MKKKKRISLESIFDNSQKNINNEEEDTSLDKIKSSSSKRANIKQQSVYLPIAVYEQLRNLAFEERLKMHDYLLIGLNKVFQEKGLPLISELIKK